jgi:hypothetical protein
MKASGSHRRLIGLTLLVGLLAACESDDPACTASSEPAIMLEIRDSVSGDGLAGEALAVVVDGGFSDTLAFLPDPDSAYQAGPSERAGTYNITVTLAGYQTWTRNGVTVEDGICHVHTENVLARLVP